jgi:hypothetical protein
LKERFGNEIKENGCEHYFESKESCQPRVVFGESIVWKINAKVRERCDEGLSII